MTAIGDTPRIVYLPLERLDKCSQCDVTSALRLCSSCSERIYCSVQCQQLDWPSHKGMCGKTDKIDLATFFPLLACLVEMSHIHPAKPVHPALLHQIVNSPNPDCPPVDTSDGWAGKPVILGDQICSPPGTEDWWPTATQTERFKLYRSIYREGYVLPIVTAVCIALLAEMYTTTSESSAVGDSKQRRTRFRYMSAPIADFGVVVGSAMVTNQDKFAYFRLSDGAHIRGQDPDQHYWIYFTTVRGEEFILDCAMFTFNMCVVVNGTQHYLPQLAPVSSFVPAYFRDRLLRRDTPELHTERKRLSVLRNEAFHRAIKNNVDSFSGGDMKTLCKFMEDLSGKTCTQKEKDLLATYTISNCNVVSATLEDRRWTRFPSTPEITREQHAEGSVGSPDGSKEWFKYMKKWKKLKKAGKVEDQSLGQAFEVWQKQWSERKKSSGC